MDSEVFCAAMIKSMDLRFSGKSVKRMQQQIVAVDLDELISLCCGHKNLTAVVVDEAKFESYGKQEFLSFWTYVCSLPHIKNLYSWKLALILNLVEIVSHYRMSTEWSSKKVIIRVD